MLHSSMYVGLSGQVALQKRLDTVAHNLANSSTAGFRAEEVKFESLISQVPNEPVAFASTGSTYLSRKAGELVETSNPLDVAVQGPAWLAIETPQGVVYTRDGRMKMTATGDLQTLTGHAVMDDGGAGIVLDPNGGPPSISQTGVISQNGRRLSTLGLFTIDPSARLTRADSSGVVPDRGVEPVVDFASAGVIQGHYERANVNPVLEISSLIAVSRSFDAVTAAITDTDGTLREAIRTLGSKS